MTPEEKKILFQQIRKYIKDNCYYTDGTVKWDDLWLVEWAAEEFYDRKNAMKVLISNEYGLLGNLLNKQVRAPDPSVTAFMEQADLKLLLSALKAGGDRAIWKNGLNNDPYAMRLLILHDAKYLRHVSTDLLNTKSFLLSVVTRYPELLQKSFARIFEDEDFVFALIQKNCACLRYLPHKYCSDYSLCLEAVRREGFSLMHIDFTLREKDELVLAAVSNRGNALSLATARQKNDRNIVYAAVGNCGLALYYAHERWKRDPEVVFRAVANRGMALQFAAPELRDREDLVRTAVENDGYAIRFASQRLRDDHALAVLALTSYPDAYKYLSPRLQEDPLIQKMYSSKKEEEKKWLPSKMR